MPCYGMLIQANFQNQFTISGEVTTSDLSATSFDFGTDTVSIEFELYINGDPTYTWNEIFNFKNSSNHNIFSMRFFYNTTGTYSSYYWDRFLYIYGRFGGTSDRYVWQSREFDFKNK